MIGRLLQNALLVGAMLAALSFPAEPWSQPTPRRIEIVAKRFDFSPGEITIKKGEPVVLVIKSMDVQHGLRIRELNIDVKIKAHETTEVPFTPENTGDFVGHCSSFCGPDHGSMMLKLHVVD